MNSKSLIVILAVVLWQSCAVSQKDEIQKLKDFFQSKEFRFEEISGIGHEKDCTRRDNSDVIKIDGKYYIYYTKIIGRSAGYWGTIWVAVSTDKGHTWNELGEVLGTGNEGQWDSQAVFTPNILFEKGTYYLYYTGVHPTPTNAKGEFENNSVNDFTAIGLAKAVHPEGPFYRCCPKPILEVSSDKNQFDSYRVDDAVLLKRNGKYRLYYKGRKYSDGNSGPAHTKMGVAAADSPDGPFLKYENNPLLASSHEVFLWQQNAGVACLASLSSTFEFAPDGLDFVSNPLSVAVDSKNIPHAAGAYRPDLIGKKTNGLTWGISMVHNKNESYLLRWEWVNKN